MSGAQHGSAGEPAAVKGAVHPVTDEIANQQDRRGLHQQRRASRGTEPMLQQRPIDVAISHQREWDHNGSDADARDGPGHERREEPIRAIGQETSPSDLDPLVASAEGLEHTEQAEEDNKRDHNSSQRRRSPGSLPRNLLTYCA